MFLSVLYFVAFFIATFSHCRESSYNAIEVIQDGPIQIIGVNDILNCDGIICPTGSIFCYVQIDSLGLLEYVNRLRVCMDVNGGITKMYADMRPNPEPGEPYHYFSSNYDIE